MTPTHRGPQPVRGLTPARAECLATLIRLCENRTPSLRELAPHIHGREGRSHNAAAQLLHYLARDGYVVQGPDQRFRATEAGRTALAEWQEEHP